MFDCLVVLSFGGRLCVWVDCGICVVFDFSFGVRWFFDLSFSLLDALILCLLIWQLACSCIVCLWGCLVRFLVWLCGVSCLVIHCFNSVVYVIIFVPI